MTNDIKPVEFTFDDNDLEALKDCIDNRWAPRARGEIGNRSCALCDLDNERQDLNPSLNDCESCIIANDTKEVGCVYTPYTSYMDVRQRLGPLNIKTKREAQKMVDYLIDLEARLLASR